MTNKKNSDDEIACTDWLIHELRRAWGKSAGDEQVLTEWPWGETEETPGTHQQPPRRRCCKSMQLNAKGCDLLSRWPARGSQPRHIKGGEGATVFHTRQSPPRVVRHHRQGSCSPDSHLPVEMTHNLQPAARPQSGDGVTEKNRRQGEGGKQVVNKNKITYYRPRWVEEPWWVKKLVPSRTIRQ